MPATVASLNVVVGADIGKALSGLNQVNRAVSGVGGFFGHAASTALGFGAAMAGLNVLGDVGGTIRDTIGGAVGLNAAFETTAIGLKTLLGPAAERFQAQLVAFARDTPFAYDQLATLSRQLLGTGFAADSIIPLLADVGNVSSAMGAGSEGVTRITRALQQMKGIGVVQRGELNQLSEVGINGIQLLAASMGKSVPQINKMLDSGKIGADVFIAAFSQFAKQPKFLSAMAEQAKSFAGIWENVQETLGLAKADIFAPVFEQLKQLGTDILAFTRTATFAQWVARLQGWVGQVTTIFGAFRAQWGALMSAHGLGVLQAGLIALELLIGRTFGPQAAGLFHSFVDLLRQVPAFVTGTVIPALGQLWTWLSTNGPAAWATLSAAVQGVLAFLGPGFVTTLATLQAEWIKMQPALIAAAASFGTLLTNLQPTFDFIANNIGPILAGFGAAMAVAFSPAVFGIALTLIGAIAAALLTLASPIVLIGAAIGLLAAAWVGNWGDIQGKVQAVWKVIQPIISTIGDWLGRAGGLLGTLLGTGAGTDFSKFLNPVTGIATAIQAPNVQTGISTALAGAAPGGLPGIMAATGGARTVDNSITVTTGPVNASDPADVNALLAKIAAASAAAQARSANAPPLGMPEGS